jgi:hypothetical protein
MKNKVLSLLLVKLTEKLLLKVQKFAHLVVTHCHFLSVEFWVVNWARGGRNQGAGLTPLLVEDPSGCWCRCMRR